MPDKRTPRRNRGVRWSVAGLLVVSGLTAAGCGSGDDRTDGPPAGQTTAAGPRTAHEPSDDAGGGDGDAPNGGAASDDGGGAAAVDIRSVDLSRFTFRVNCLEEPVDVSFGQDTPPGSGPAQVLSEWNARYDDVTGDGVAEALVSAVCSPADGGNLFVSSVAVITATPDGPAQLGEPIDGFAPAGVDGTLVVDVAEPAADDPGCCPSVIRSVPLRYLDDTWTPGSDGVPVQPGDLVSSDAIGSVKVGMTLHEIAAATGEPVVREELDLPGRPCLRVTIEGTDGVEAVSTAVDFDGRRAYVGALIVTDPSNAARDVRVGDTRDQVLAVRPDAVARDGALILERPDGERVIIYVFEDGDGTITDAVTEIRVGATGPASGGRCRTFD